MPRLLLCFDNGIHSLKRMSVGGLRTVSELFINTRRPQYIKSVLFSELFCLFVFLQSLKFQR